MSIVFQFTDTKEGVWISSPKDYQKEIANMDVWSSYNASNNKWLIKKTDIHKVLRFLKTNKVPYNIDQNMFVECSFQTLNKTNNYVCNPETGRWVLKDGKIGTHVLEKYKNIVQKIPPIYAPTIENLSKNNKAVKLDSICAYFQNIQLNKELIDSKREQILEEWTTPQEDNPNTGSFTEQGLYALFLIIDREYFNGKITQYLLDTSKKIKVFPSEKSFSTVIINYIPCYY
jgi:hypothetical protein